MLYCFSIHIHISYIYSILYTFFNEKLKLNETIMLWAFLQAITIQAVITDEQLNSPYMLF